MQFEAVVKSLVILAESGDGFGDFMPLRPLNLQTGTMVESINTRGASRYSVAISRRLQPSR
jgi:hypothetical protein